MKGYTVALLALHRSSLIIINTRGHQKLIAGLVTSHIADQPVYPIFLGKILAELFGVIQLFSCLEYIPCFFGTICTAI